MNQDELRETLQQLHTELAATDEIDSKSLEILNQLTSEVDRIVSGNPEGNVPEAPENDSDMSYSDQMRSMMSTFETQHPVVSGLLERLSDGLANLGI